VKVVLLVNIKMKRDKLHVLLGELASTVRAKRPHQQLVSTVYVAHVGQENSRKIGNVKIVKLGSTPVGGGQLVVLLVHPVNIKMERDKLHVKM
jgi:hypothetical protein